MSEWNHGIRVEHEAYETVISGGGMCTMGAWSEFVVATPDDECKGCGAPLVGSKPECSYCGRPAPGAMWRQRKSFR